MATAAVRMLKLILVLSAVAVLVAPVLAQRSRYTSPPAKSSVVVAGKKITVDYYAPSAHGRKIMGGLVPYGVVWCTGANIATELTIEGNLQIGTLKLSKGAYSIWTLPAEKEWTLIVNKETGQFHLNYDPSVDVGRTRMNLRTLATPVETFRVDLRNDGGNQGTLSLVWETTEASIPFTVLP
jgi:hypothetical protein